MRQPLYSSLPAQSCLPLLRPLKVGIPGITTLHWESYPITSTQYQEEILFSTKSCTCDSSCYIRVREVHREWRYSL